MNKITIDGKEYDLSNMSDELKTQIGNVKLCDQRLQKLQQELAITQTARNAYASTLKGALATEN
jgi:hypothetical protein